MYVFMFYECKSILAHYFFEYVNDNLSFFSSVYFRQLGPFCICDRNIHFEYMIIGVARGARGTRHILNFQKE